MSTAATPTPASVPEPASTTLLGRIVELTARVGTSWFGLVAGYFAALSAALFAYQKLEEPLKGTPWWVRPVVAVAPLVFVFFGHTVPALIDQRRRKRLKEISGDLKPGYFRLSPREPNDEKDFTRADNKHEDVLRWVKERRAAVLYLTGQSGSGKSSILSAWVVPKLSKEEPPVKIVQVRGHQDPVSVILNKLREPDVIWNRPPDIQDVRQLLERACQKLRPTPLLVIFDQFEEFVILHDRTYCERFADLLASLVENRIQGLTMLLVLRSDYIGILDQLGLPKLVQDVNWTEVPAFTESAASTFLRGSNLQISDDVLRDVLREAAEAEQTKGLIRPITLNLCGLVLGRFATGLPRQMRPGTMIRGFVRESVEQPEIREVTPKLIPPLITESGTKRPRLVSDLVKETSLDESSVRGCLRVLAKPDRGIVRALDEQRERWEISHDFLVPLLDAIFVRWSVSLWRRTRPFFPWFAAAGMALLALAVSLRPKDPIVELTSLGWQVKQDKKGEVTLTGIPNWRESGQAVNRLRYDFVHIVLNGHDTLAGIEILRDMKSPLTLHIHSMDYLLLGVTSRLSDLTPLRELKTLKELNVAHTEVADVSALRELKRLSKLMLGNTKVVNLRPLRELPNLTYLDLSSRGSGLLSYRRTDVTPMPDLTGLRELKSLEQLNISNTQVTDLTPLRDLKSLSSLDLSYNTRLADLTPLRDLKSLSSLDLTLTGVTDLTPLRDLKSLKQLDLRYTQVTDLTPLRDLKSLSSLDLTRTQVADLSPLRELKSLSTLDLRNNEVTDRPTVELLKQRGVKVTVD